MESCGQQRVCVHVCVCVLWQRGLVMWALSYVTCILFIVTSGRTSRGPSDMRPTAPTSVLVEKGNLHVEQLAGHEQPHCDSRPPPEFGAGFGQ